MGINLKKCVKCGLPETYETIEFNNHDVCNICVQQNFKNNQWHVNEMKQEGLQNTC